MNSRISETAIVAYVASPHDGYLKFFRHYAGMDLWILGEDFISEFPSLVRHLPGNRPDDARKMIAALGIFRQVRILTKSNIDAVRQYAQLVMPDEDVSREVSMRFFLKSVLFDGRWRLRWYTTSVAVGRKPEGEEVVTAEEFSRLLMRRALKEAERSPDWWRQVCAKLVRDGAPLITAINRHRPAEQSCYVLGDPRSCFGPGECIEVSASGHAEPAVAAEAMRRGICTVGCDLYVTTFPCPPCAYLWSESGIKRLFYIDGYSLISGAEDLKKNGVQIVRVALEASL